MIIEQVSTSPELAERLLGRAADLVPLLKRRAPATEELRQIPAETIGDLRAAELIRIAVPRRFGGFGLGQEVVVEVAWELARGCGATSWCYSLWATHAWLVGHWPLRAQEEFFADSPDVLSASSFASGGARATRVDGGLRVSGRWMFSSGCDGAAWLLLGLDGPDGELWALVPRAHCEILDTWFVSGLSGTGSKNIAVHDIFVPAHRLLSPPGAEINRPPGSEIHHEPSYRVPVVCVLGWDVVTPAIGIAQSAIDEFTSRLRGTTGGKSAEWPVVQLRLSEAAAEVEAAKALLRQDMRAIARKAERNEPFTALEIAGYSRDKAFAAKLSLQAVERLFQVSGARSLLQSDPLQRIYRDAVAASHHDAAIFDLGGQMFGRLALGLLPPPAPPRAVARST